MKHFILGLSLPLLLAGFGFWALTYNINHSDAQELSKQCTWTEVKLCYGGVPNRCCPPKAMEAVEGDGDLARNCTWSQVKDCYSGDPNPNNPCCPPKAMEAVEGDGDLARNCSWSDVKACYSGRPVTNSSCCPPKVMDQPIM